MSAAIKYLFRTRAFLRFALDVLAECTSRADDGRYRRAYCSVEDDAAASRLVSSAVVVSTGIKAEDVTWTA